MVRDGEMIIISRLHSLERILTFKIRELLSLYYKYCEFNRICCFLLSNRKKPNYYLESILVLIGDSDTESYRMDVPKIYHFNTLPENITLKLRDGVLLS